MIFKFVVISSEEESFVREFELDENNTLLDFHNCIQEELEYDNSQMAIFFTASNKWEKEEEFTLFDMGSATTPMDEVTIDEILLNENQKLLYIFDIFNERALFIECIGSTDEVEDRSYPVCISSQGKPPKQLAFADFIGNELSMSDDDDDYDDTDDDLDDVDEADLPEYDSIEDFDNL